MSRWVLVLALWWTAAAEDARRAQRAEVARVDAIKGALAEPCWAGGCASLDEALEADADGELGTVGVVIAWCADDFHWVGDVLRMVAACVEIKILRRVHAIDATPVQWRAPDTLVDFHTDDHRLGHVQGRGPGHARLL